MLVATVVAAPWMVTPLTTGRVAVLAALTVGGVALWLVACAVDRRMPAVPAPLAIIVTAVLVWGAWMTLNAHSHYDARLQRLVHRAPPIAWLPGALDARTSARALVPIAVALVGTLALIDLARRAPFRTIALWVLALDGAAISTVGALGRLHVLTLFHHHDPQGGTPFASFGYHGNAAAYLDLTLPAALALVASARRRRDRVGAATLVVAILTGAATQASKFGLVAAIAILVTFAMLLTRRTAARPGRTSAGIRVTAVLVGVLLAVSGGYLTRHRWSELPDEVHAHNGRAEIWRVAIDVWRREPLVGSGPGSFKLLVPSVATRHEPGLFSKWIVTPYRPGQPVTIWMYAHDDALQTLAEWGALGLAAFATIVLWPIGTAIRRRRRPARDRPVLLAGLVGLGAVVIHSLVDFPLQILAIELTAGLWAALLIGSFTTKWAK